LSEPTAPEAFLSLASVAAAEDSFDSTLQQVVDLACTGVAGCSMAGITLLGPGGPTTAVASSEIAANVDSIQYRVNAGPCLDAYRRQAINRIDSTDSDERWPEFSRGAAAAGVHAVLSYPLIVAGDGIGALNLYGETEYSFDDETERLGAVFATHASITLANASAFWRTEELRRNLEQALATRGVIDQAKGILMKSEGYTADEAFDVLKRASQRANRKVHDIAQQIVDGARRARQPGGE
jgi:transcriptional regulator with GAF, ATPase, and Fis domain